MAEIATQNSIAEDEMGIRRLVVKGSPIPQDWHVVEGDVQTETVPTRSLAEVVVDEEASKSHFERFGTGKGVAPGDGEDYSNAERLAGEKPEAPSKGRKSAAKSE